jgi:hypothetical protein
MRGQEGYNVEHYASSRRARFVTALAVTALLAGGAPAWANLIVNGDFEAGNSGFSSAYAFSPGNIFPEGTTTS